VDIIIDVIVGLIALAVAIATLSIPLWVVGFVVNNLMLNLTVISDSVFNTICVGFVTVFGLWVVIMICFVTGGAIRQWWEDRC
jgi:hypothetical protein